MGRGTFSRSTYAAASREYVPPTGDVTKIAEQKARTTGKLHELVDPASYNSTRRSFVRFEERADERFMLTVGCSMPVETRLDTTGSMGGNVNVAVKVLPDAYELCSKMLPGYDLHMLISIFGDVVDRFVLCRPQFEMEAAKLVEQLTLMVPERAGGDADEDPQYGLFGAAYLVRAYANLIGLKGYDFTISDARGRGHLEPKTLKRIFGDDVFANCKANGFDIDPRDVPSTLEVVRDLLQRAHGFFLQVGSSEGVTRFWSDLFGEDRIVILPDTKLLPQVQATIIGLTEGTLSLDQVSDFLTENNVSKQDAKAITRSVANIPIGAQVPLREAIVASGHQIPVAGDIFKVKPDYFAGTDLWPVDHDDDVVTVPDVGAADDDAPNWL